MLQLTLLGDCRIEWDGEPLAGLSLSKARALLCYLAVTGRPQTRSALIELLWGGMGEAVARRNLRVVLTKLRAAVSDYVLTTRTDIAFNTHLPHTLDVAQFEQAAQTALDAPGPLAANHVTTLEQSFARYKGEFLSGLEVHRAAAFEEWVVLQRERLRRLALQVGERLAQHYEATRQTRAGIAVCQRLIQIDPLQEEVHRHLMGLLWQNGQPAEALRQFEQCRRALAEELGIAPDGATLALVARIRAEMRGRDDLLTPNSTPSAPNHNLPAPTTPFVGRAKEMAQAEALLSDPTCRLLTLIGLGGVGKTRLALQIAHNLLAAHHTTPFRHGIYFVSLAACDTADQMVAAMAGALQLTFSGSQVIRQQWLSHLRGKAMLLVLDNFEHLVREAPLLTEMLQAANELKLLVTSRERLDLHEEWLLDVHGLLCLAANTAESSDAVQLFTQRARRLHVQFDEVVVQDEVADICRMLEGLPLGIELAAGWVRAHTCHEIAHKIRHSLDFLQTSTQNVPLRHRSLRIAFDYSWDMLTREEADTLARLAVFRGEFDASAAASVAGAMQLDLERLADKSLVERKGDERWAIHAMLRQYLAEKLGESEWAEAQARHARFYAQVIAQRAPLRETAAEPEALGQLRRDIGNAHAAWEWLMNQLKPDAKNLAETIACINQCAPMLAYFYIRECGYQEGWRLFADARQAMLCSGWKDGGDEKSSTLARIELLLAEFAFSLSQYAEVVALIETALPVLRRMGQHVAAAEALAVLGKARIRMGQYATTDAMLIDSLVLFDSAGNRKGSTVALNWLAAWHSNQGQYEEAQAYFEKCLDIFRETGYRRGIANTLNNLGSNYGRNDQFSEEQPLYEEAYPLALEVGERILIAVTLSNMADNARSRGDFEQSRHYYQLSLAHCREMGERRWVAANLNGLGVTLLDMRELSVAWEVLHEALAVACETQSLPDQLDALAGLGEVLAKGAQRDLAARVLRLVVQHPVTQRMARARCRRVLDDGFLLDDVEGVEDVEKVEGVIEQVRMFPPFV
jgi:DNA-binding SARP family transcriptional activator/predicted ATPase